jgi:hypothetical protein
MAGRQAVNCVKLLNFSETNHDLNGPDKTLMTLILLLHMPEYENLFSGGEHNSYHAELKQIFQPVTDLPLPEQTLDCKETRHPPRGPLRWLQQVFPLADGDFRTDAGGQRL